MSLANIPLVSWVNSPIVIGIFVVVIGLIAAVYMLMNSDKKAKN